MPSPFPGMDPYLEHPGLWPDVHHELISAIRESLGQRLRPRYVVRVEERVYVANEADMERAGIRVPDVIVAMREQRAAHIAAAAEVEGGVAVEVAEPVIATTWAAEPIHEAYLTIVEREPRTVVTVIEVLSPANKVSGPGRDSFEAKREEIMGSRTHWVEIDLLRMGQSAGARRHLAPCDYLAHVSPATLRPRGILWPIRLHQRLPVITIPLAQDDADAKLDLQAVLATSYDRAGYDLEIDYARDPVPPLKGETAEWADALLKEKGLRPGTVA